MFVTLTGGIEPTDELRKELQGPRAQGDRRAGRARRHPLHHRRCPRPAAARSCAGCCATSPPAGRRPATRPRWKTSASWPSSAATRTNALLPIASRATISRPRKSDCGDSSPNAGKTQPLMATSRACPQQFGHARLFSASPSRQTGNVSPAVAGRESQRGRRSLWTLLFTPDPTRSPPLRPTSPRNSRSPAAPRKQTRPGSLAAPGPALLIQSDRRRSPTRYLRRRHR